MGTRQSRIAAAIVLLATVGAAWVIGHPGRPGRPLPATPGRPAPADSISEALRLARASAAPRPRPDSASAGRPDKSRWVAEVKGFPATDLAPARREAFIGFANAQRCTCGCGFTLAGCRSYDPSCPVSGPRVERLLDSVRAGFYSRAGSGKRLTLRRSGG